jgi:hypothetical protein
LESDAKPIDVDDNEMLVTTSLLSWGGKPPKLVEGARPLAMNPNVGNVWDGNENIVSKAALAVKGVTRNELRSSPNASIAVVT